MIRLSSENSKDLNQSAKRFKLMCLNQSGKLLNLIGAFATNLGPVVQSLVSLTSSLRVISLTVLADSVHNILIYFALQKLLTFFQQKISAYLHITRCKF